MAATFQIIVTGLRTGTVGEFSNVVKKVEFIVKGTEQGQSFELPETTDLNEIDPQNFIELQNLTEANVIAFIESAYPHLDAKKAHIQAVLDKEVAKNALTAAPLPWVAE